MPTDVLPVASRALVAACRSLGVDTASLLARAGVSPAALDDPDARLPAANADAIWREAFAATGDARLSLHAAEATPFGAFPALDYLVAASATVGEGLERAARYFPLVDPRGRLDVERSRGAVAVVFRGAGVGALPAPAQEYTLAVIHARIGHVAAAPVSLVEVRFAFPRPSAAGEHARVFGLTPRFAAKDAALVLSREAWDTPTRNPDAALSIALDEHTRRRAAAIAEGDVVGRVRAAIMQDLPGREPSLAAAARRLAWSRRSLQRRLEAHGTTFADLVAAVRREHAEALLADRGVSIAEVSWLVGFSEQSAFTRAFRRWTGRSPSAFRQAL